MLFILQEVAFVDICRLLIRLEIGVDALSGPKL